jgi:hypothetical protein
MGKGLYRKWPEPFGRREDVEGAGQSRETGCGGHRPEVEAFREKRFCVAVRKGSCAVLE